MKQRRMGNTGLYVSELCLGTMNFGMPDWGIEKEESIEVIDAYLERGGNFLDTADVYAGGISEEICGKALKGRRDDAILATKGHLPVTRRFGDPPRHTNALGSSRRHLTLAVEASLKRLRTDYIDLYQVHCWDAHTPIEETLSTLDMLIKSGKIRYAGLSNFTAWQIAESRQLCIRHGWEPFVTAQMQYSLACRDIESDVVPVCQRYGIGILPWSPLAGGVLTGKYNNDLTGPEGARYGQQADPDNDWRSRFVNERCVAIGEAVKSVAAECEAPPASVALAWLLRQPGVTSVIIGPKSVDQWKENLAACSLTLSDVQVNKLNEASPPPRTYPEWFIAATQRNQGTFLPDGAAD